MARSVSLTVSTSVTRLALGFVAGFLATLTFHQIGIWILHAVGYIPFAAWATAPKPPFGRRARLATPRNFPWSLVRKLTTRSASFNGYVRRIRASLTRAGTRGELRVTHRHPPLGEGWRLGVSGL